MESDQIEIERPPRERRLAPRRASDRNEATSPRVDACLVCGEITLQHTSLRINRGQDERYAHVHCAIRLAREVLDQLQGVELIPSPSNQKFLSQRELEILEGMARGDRDRAIGERLGISERTVKNHTYDIRQKLGVRTRAEAAAQAVRLGLLGSRRT